MIDLNWKPSDRELRQFAFFFLLAAAIVGGVLWWRWDLQKVAYGLWIAGPIVALVGWFAPRAVKPLFIGMSVAAWPIGMVLGFVLLAITYYLIVTPVGLLFKLFRHDPMHRRFDREADTYWIKRPPPAPAARYFRQF
jgi:hypothetical protein